MTPDPLPASDQSTTPMPPCLPQRTWYFAWHYEHGNAWRILATPHDLDTSEGLLAIIEETKEQQAHTKVVPMYWREMDA